MDSFGRAARTLGRHILGIAAGALGAVAMLAAPALAGDAALRMKNIRPGVPGGVVPSAQPSVFVPGSGVSRRADVGQRAHTNVNVMVPDAKAAAGLPPALGYLYETPASIACIYRLTAFDGACNPNKVTAVPLGRGSRAIAIVDAYHNPNAAKDLAAFNAQFGLPPANLTIVYANGAVPPVDPSGGWALESNLDLQYAHAMAPNARLILVEAGSNSFADLLKAEKVASQLVARAGGGQISNSWSGSEWASEATYDTYFAQPGVTYFASTGDAPGTGWPSVSARVVAVGGTSVVRSASTGAFLYESSWTQAGMGISGYVPRPTYQNVIQAAVGARRGVPDVSLVANPNTGAWVYNSNPLNGAVGTWYIVGGTSLASPLAAGIVNAAGGFASSTPAELANVYGALANATAYAANWTDVKSGTCGKTGTSTAKAGWDICTGVGSPKGLVGK
jgi:subtilase family serine protease